MGRKRVGVAVRAPVVVGVLCAWASAAEQDVPYGLPKAAWPQAMGNHRAGVRVAEKAEAVWAHVLWRRHDPTPEAKDVVVVDAATGKVVKNVVRAAINREFGDIIFQPPTAPGEYYIYYMPYTESPLQHAWTTQYTTPQSTADRGWLERNALSPQKLTEGKWQSLPKAKVLEFQARSEFHRFEPMEVIATAQETEELLARHNDVSYLLFPEDRRYPIRMTDDLPSRWIRSGPTLEFRDKVKRGEFYVFQIGVYACKKAIEDVAVGYSDIKSPEGKAIPASAFRCFNISGTDWLGRPIKRSFDVAAGKVRALWFGVQIPTDAASGEHTATVTITPKAAPPSEVKLSLHISNDVIEDCGDADLWRLARLRWLDSTVGLDDEPTAPYTPLTIDARTVSCLGRTVRFGATGLPESIRSRFTKTGRLDAPPQQHENTGREILAGPIRMAVQTAEGIIQWVGGEPALAQNAPGAVTITSSSRGGPLSLSCRTKMESDGYLNCSVTLKTTQPVDLGDVRLEIPYRSDAATYMMGLGRKGGLRPKDWNWTWDAGRANNTVWLGAPDAGLYCKLKGPQDTWDIHNLTAGIPPSWGNGGKGGCTISEDGKDTVLLRAHTGPRTLKPNDELELRFGLLITPVKPLDPDHWKQRYYHAYAPPEKAVQSGANIINVHHGNEINPHINYPFVTADKLAAYVRDAHAKGVKVKIYYTVRELSNYAAELWPLRSLGYEVFTDGPGGGHSWLHEHLVSHYTSAWHQPLADGEVDAAIATTGLSRWHNYYLEGLGWLLRNAQIDGLYLDGIGYDREIMKRVRKIMDRNRPGCLIDFHSGNEFPFNDMRLSPACKYMEHFPFINSLWFGEGYDYNETPDYWLVEVSGIPFGLFGEMLEGNGNPWRGMIYGMSARYYSGADPKHIWKLWDEFGIQDATMFGYWTDSCPVKTDHPDVLSTAYCKKGKVLVSLASWAKTPVRCKLKVDWKAIGLDPEKAGLYAPSVPAFQWATLFKPSEEIPVQPARGWLLIIDEQKHEIPASADAYSSRNLLLEDRFDGDRLREGWGMQLSAQPNTRLGIHQGQLLFDTTANGAAFVERPLPAGATLVECRVFSGTDDGASWGPGLCVVWPQKSLRINVRSDGRFGVDDGATQVFGGTTTKNAWYFLRIRLEEDAVLAEASVDGRLWETIHSAPRGEFPGDPVVIRVGKMSPGGKCEDFATVGPPGTCALDDLRVFGKK